MRQELILTFRLENGSSRLRLSHGHVPPSLQGRSSQNGEAIVLTGVFDEVVLPATFSRVIGGDSGLSACKKCPPPEGGGLSELRGKLLELDSPDQRARTIPTHGTAWERRDHAEASVIYAIDPGDRRCSGGDTGVGCLRPIEDVLKFHANL